VRRFWRGDPGVLPELVSRLAGSSDAFAHNGRHPRASINIVTVHDGFTLADLVSYDHKHNEANHEGQPRRRRRQLQLELRRRGTDERS
jgi:isoamylase